MTKAVKLGSIFMVLIAGMMTHAFAGTEHQFDVKGYDQIAKKAIGMVISGNVDADNMLADMEKLVGLGVSGCKEHMGEAETPPEETKIMQLTIDNAQNMTSLTLADIESQWHEGGFLKTNGVDLGEYDHFSEVMCHYDGVVHPATAIICLKEYKKTNNADLLEQIKDELAEVREHMRHLE